MRDDNGIEHAYPVVTWKGESCFWWYMDQVLCSNPNEAQQLKLADLAQQLKAYCAGDDGERYELRKSLFGRQRLVIVPAEQ